MHSKLSITFPANVVVFAMTSGGMGIEKHGSRIINETSLKFSRKRPRTHIVSLAIERLGVIDCTSTFFFSRQVHKPTVGACNTFVSVNEFCKNNVIIESPSNTPNK